MDIFFFFLNRKKKLKIEYKKNVFIMCPSLYKYKIITINIKIEYTY